MQKFPSNTQKQPTMQRTLLLTECLLAAATIQLATRAHLEVVDSLKSVIVNGGSSCLFMKWEIGNQKMISFLFLLWFLWIQFQFQFLQNVPNWPRNRNQNFDSLEIRIDPPLGLCALTQTPCAGKPAVWPSARRLCLAVVWPPFYCIAFADNADFADAVEMRQPTGWQIMIAHFVSKNGINPTFVLTGFRQRCNWFGNTSEGVRSIALLFFLFSKTSKSRRWLYIIFFTWRPGIGKLVLFSVEFYAIPWMFFVPEGVAAIDLLERYVIDLDPWLDSVSPDHYPAEAPAEAEAKNFSWFCCLQEHRSSG